MLTKFAEINHQHVINGPPTSVNVIKASVKTDVVNDLSKSSWFYRVIALIFGFALVLIADLLYNFPSAPINKINPWSTDELVEPWGMIEQYSILLSVCVLILVVLIASCLGFAAKSTSIHRFLTTWQSRTLYLSKRTQRNIGGCLWVCLLMTLIVGVVVFDWYIFDRQGAVVTG